MGNILKIAGGVILTLWGVKCVTVGIATIANADFIAGVVNDMNDVFTPTTAPAAAE
jgi:hypothetical protein